MLQRIESATVKHAKRQKGQKGARGFTLIELLVAMGVMAGMAVMAWQGLDAMARTRAMAVERGDKLAALNIGLQQWVRDLDMMVQTPPLSILQWDGRVLSLVRRSGGGASDGPVLAAWTRGVRGSGQGHWLRWQSKPVTSRTELLAEFERVNDWAHSAGDAGRQQEASVLQIDDWQIYFYRGGAWTNPLSRDLPPGEGRAMGFSTNSLTPGVAIDGIRIVLTLPPGHPLGGSITRDWVRPTLSDAKS
jgi:general secretion pathway protein J